MTEQILEEIKQKIVEYHKKKFANTHSDYTPASAKYFDERELIYATEAVLDGWWTEGRFSIKFASELAKFLDVKYAILTNSGSSANLLAMSALTSHLLGDDKLKPGDEVITVSGGFPTTVNPIIQHGLVPVLIDIEIGTYNTTPEMVEAAITDKTRAVMIAHTLGNPYKVREIKELCERYNLFLIEDCCDAFGSTYEGKKVGSFGDLATLSMYPAHHITTGEGGAVFTNNSKLKKAVQSIRDWGKDCWCPPGKDNSCCKRFDWTLGDLPEGYDHKYIFSHLGYNLKTTDLQSALGLAQLEKVDFFTNKRKANFVELWKGLEDLQEKLILPLATQGSEPSWFGFPITVKGDEKKELIAHLENKGIGTRPLFCGDITKQPFFKNYDFNYRVVGDLENTNQMMLKTFWIGLHPKIGPVERKKIIDAFKGFYISLP
jgi:CDP-4-dehydro-6-deoxyglucose reductase, E1